jgi:hypothetical protein
MMTKRIPAVLCYLLAVGLFSGILAQGKKVTFSGYLVDQMCGEGIKDASKAAEHTKECALMDHCAAAGYGIFTEGKFIKFDPESSKKAKALLETTRKEKDLQIVVEGVLKDDVLTVVSLREKGAK